VETEVLIAPERSDTLGEALALLRQSPASVLPIRDPLTGDVVAVLSRPETLPPVAVPRLGGMATPLGVYLTDGVVSGGAGFWGLFLTGITLGTLALLAEAVVQGLLALAAAHGLNFWAWVASPRCPVALRAWLPEASDWLPVPLIFVLLRLIPMSGTHAAEHQVVHCVERGLPLAASEVRAQPRVHPRCGTNLFVGFSVFLLVFVSVFCILLADGQPIAAAATLALVAAAVPALALWRRIGGFVQQWFATRPATDKQIAGAIRAAEQVLCRRRSTGLPVRFRVLRRVWNMGLVQVLLGYLTLYQLLTLMFDHWPHLEHWLGL
jgi:hypothetical protein